MTTQQTTGAYQLRINLFGVSPPVRRRVRVSADTTIAKLHDIIQVAMGWQDVHLHEFCIRFEKIAPYIDTPATKHNAHASTISRPMRFQEKR